MFSFGVLMYRLISGKRPFATGDKKEISRFVVANKYTMDGECWAMVSDEAKSFIRGLIINRDRRFTAETASLHKWFHAQKSPNTFFPIPEVSAEHGSTTISRPKGEVTLSKYDDDDSLQSGSKWHSLVVAIIRSGALDREIESRITQNELRSNRMVSSSTSRSALTTYVETTGTRSSRVNRGDPPGTYVDHVPNDSHTQCCRDKQERWAGSVFVSHTGRDEHGAIFAAHLCHSLYEDGIDAFFDSKSIQEGELFEEKIVESVKGCAVFVCVLTENYYRRYWCMRELDIAIQSEKTLIPVYLPEEPPDADNTEFANEFIAIHSTRRHVDQQVILRWLNNIRYLKKLQAVWNHSQPKYYQVEMKKCTVRAVKRVLRREPF